MWSTRVPRPPGSSSAWTTRTTGKKHRSASDRSTSSRREVPHPATGAQPQRDDESRLQASQPNTVTTNIYFALRGKHTGDGGAVDVESPWDDFRVYAMDWNSERMDFFCDGVKYYTFDLSKADENGNNPFRQPHSLLLNLALVGGKGAIDDGSLPQRFVVDYACVYQRVEEQKRTKGRRVESKESH